MKQMSDKIYTVEEELRQLEFFLENKNIQNNYNYVRMEKGPKPLFYRFIAFSYQLSSFVLDFYFLVFTDNHLILLTKDENYEFSTDYMTTINYNNIHHFSFEQKSGFNSYYLIFFQYDKEDYYFYLDDRVTNRILDKFLNYPVKNVSYENLSYLEEMDFMGLSSKDK